jgi:extradiol dioxygenase family protein
VSDTNIDAKPFPSSTQSSSVVYPKLINHIAVSVCDLDQAIKWYVDVLGFTMVAGTVEFVDDDSLLGRALRDIHGPDLKKMRVASLRQSGRI